MDAIRIQDGLPVILKKVLSVESPYDSELRINRYFSSREFARMADNHCVPMLDVVELQHSGSHQLMVFPHLLPFHRSRIRTLKEFIIFITQICEVWASFTCVGYRPDAVIGCTGHPIYA
jgi:hypothetical protein